MKTLCLIAGILFGAVLGGRAQPPVRIALVADTHTNRSPKGDQPLYRGRFDQVIAQVNAARVDVVLVAGDLTQNGRADERADFKRQAAGFRAPVLWVPGNHDVGNKLIPGRPGGVTPARVAAYEKAMGPSFFAREVAGVRFIGLNSSLFGSGLPEEGRMWSFLEGQLAAPRPEPTVVFMHYPPYVRSPDEPGGTYWNIEPAARRRLLGLLERGGVKTVLTGHLHYQLIHHWNGILVVTSPPVSFGLPRGVAPEGWTLITLPARGEATVEFKRVY